MFTTWEHRQLRASLQSSPSAGTSLELSIRQSAQSHSSWAVLKHRKRIKRMFQSAEYLLRQKNRSGVPYAAHVKTVKLSARHEVCKRYSAGLGSAQLGLLRLDSLHLAARCLLGANFAQRLCIESRALEARCRPGRVSSALMREQFGSVRFMLARTLRVVVPSPNRSPSRSRSVSRSRQKTSRSPQSAPQETRSRLVSYSSRF